MIITHKYQLLVGQLATINSRPPYAMVTSQYHKTFCFKGLPSYLLNISKTEKCINKSEGGTENVDWKDALRWEVGGVGIYIL